MSSRKAGSTSPIACSSTTPFEVVTLKVPPLPELSSNVAFWRHTEIYNLFKQVHLLGYDFSGIASKMRQTEDVGLHPKNFYTAASCEAQFKVVLEATKNDPYHVKFFEKLGAYSERTHADRLYKQYDHYCKVLRSLIKGLVVNGKLKNVLLAFQNGGISIEHYPQIETIIDECSKLVELAATFDEHQTLTKYKNVFEKLIPSGDNAKFKTVAEMRAFLSGVYEEYLIRHEIGDLTLGNIGDMLGSPEKTVKIDSAPVSPVKVVASEAAVEPEKLEVEPVVVVEKRKKPVPKEKPTPVEPKKVVTTPVVAEEQPKKPELPEPRRRSSKLPIMTSTPSLHRLKQTRLSLRRKDPPIEEKTQPESPNEPVFKKPRLPASVLQKSTPPTSKKPVETTTIHVDTPRPMPTVKSQLSLITLATANAHAAKMKAPKKRNGKMVVDAETQTHLVGVDSAPSKIKIISRKPAPPTRDVPGAVKRHFATQTGPMQVSDDYPIRWIDNVLPCQSITTDLLKTCYRSYSRFVRSNTISFSTSLHRHIVDPSIRQPVVPLADNVKKLLDGMIRRDFRAYFRHPVRFEVDKYRRIIKCPMDTLTIEDLIAAGKIKTLNQLEIHAALIYANAVVYGAVVNYAQLQNYATGSAFQKAHLAERRDTKP